MVDEHFFSTKNKIIKSMISGAVALCLTACSIMPFHTSTVPEGYGNLGTEKGARDSTPVCLEPTAPGVDVKENKYAHLDYSNSSEGYVIVRYTGSSPKVKLQITGPNEVTYTYNLCSTEPTDEVFPLQSGNGEYMISVYENIKANRYSTVFSYPIRVTLSDQYKPFLYPNQFVNFNKDSLGVAEAQKLAYPCNNDLEVISQIYFYVIENMSYDYDKAAVVKSGYLPDIDQVFTAKKGICLDYAALMASMLRSQNIPTKMEIGYAGNVYHAWLSSYVNGIGWINGMIEFDGVDWSLMDPTFATTMKKRKLQSFISDSDNYSAKYIY